MFFTAASAGGVRRLWSTDGTGDGTRPVADLTLGIGWGPAAIEGQLLFVATEATGGGLWRSDGTAAGTRKIYPGDTTTPNEFIVESIVVDGSCAWLAASDGISGMEPWRYCLSDDRVVQLADLVPGAASSDPQGFDAAGGLMFFNTAVGLFISDARSDTVKPFAPAAAPNLHLDYPGFTQYRGLYYFAATSAAHGSELWRTDGTVTGTELVLDSMPGPASGGPWGLAVMNDKLYFAAETPEHGRELRVSDGTAMGTRLVSDINPGPGSADIYFTHVNGGNLYFAAIDETGRTTVWRSDGTQTGTRALAMPDGVDFVPIVVFSYASLADRVVFIAQSEQFGFEPWSTTGADAIVQLGDIYPGPADSMYSSYFGKLGDQIIFGASSPDTGWELWRTRGTADTTQLLANLAQDDNADSWFGVFAHDDGIYLTGPGEGPPDHALWVTDGTSAGTVRLRNFPGFIDQYEIPRRGRIENVFELDEALTFDIDSMSPDQAGQWILRDGRVDRISEQRLLYPVRVAENIISLAPDGNLWRTTGEKGSVAQIAQLSDRGRLSRFPHPEVAGDQAWFFADTPEERLSLWRSDGTANGTQLVGDGLPLPVGRYTRFLGTLGEAVFFVERGKGVTLWRADANGLTALRTVGSIWEHTFGGIERGTRIADKLVFIVRQVTRPVQIWVTDGTAAGTVQLVTDVDHPGFRPFGAGVALDGHVYFVAFDPERGETLWRTDGTPQGTSLFADVEPGFDESAIGNLVVHNAQLYFVATTRASGAEIWKTDGQRLAQVTELMPGSLSASPRLFQSTGGRLIFRADDGVHGFEPWVLDPAVATQP